MLITKLKVDYFGKLSGKEIELKPGINLIYGENEAGKSTLHEFIKGILFGIERMRGRGAGSKDDTYVRYLPWDYPGAYGGQMDIEMADRVYRLQRSFLSNDKSFTLLDLATGREIKLKEGHISELIPGLTEASFRNTISIEQLRAETGPELASQVRNYITNLSIAKSREVNVEKAVSSLKEQKKALKAVPYDLQLKSLSDEIQLGIEREDKIDSLTAQLKYIENKKIKLKEEASISKKSKKVKVEELVGELPAILEKHRRYQELKRQYSQEKVQIEDLKAKISGWEKEAKQGQGLNKEYRKELHNLNKEQDDGISASRNKILYIAASIILAMVGFHFSKSYIIGGAVLLILWIIGGALLVARKKRSHTAKQDVQVLLEEVKKHYSLDLSLNHSREQLKELMDRRKSLEDNLDQIHDDIMIYMQEFVSEEELTEEAVERLQEAIKNKKNEAINEQNKLNTQLEEYRFQIEKIGWELSQLEDNETELIKNKDQHTYIKQKQEQNELEVDAINLALSAIHDLSSTIHDSFGMQLNEAVSAIIAQVTNYKYQDLKIDEKLNIKLGWNDNYIIFDRLSAGTIDQVYFALRLAVSDLLHAKEPMPLILDDSFALYDDKRAKATLAKIADRKQVILLSCQRREKRLLEELELPYNLIKL